MTSARDTAAEAMGGLAMWRWSLDWALSASVAPLSILAFAYAIYDATLPSAPPMTNVLSILVVAAVAFALVAMNWRELRRCASPEGRRAALTLSVMIPITAIASLALAHHSFLSALARLD